MNFEEISVIPGLDGLDAPFGSQTTVVYQTSEKWQKKREMAYDYGLITLPNDQMFQRIRGYFILQTKQNKGMKVWGGGYLDLDPHGQEDPMGYQAITSGKIKKVYSQSISFTNELHVGYSGGPLYLERTQNNLLYHYLVGLGTYIYTYNFGPRISDYIIQEIEYMKSNS